MSTIALFAYSLAFPHFRSAVNITPKLSCVEKRRIVWLKLNSTQLKFICYKDNITWSFKTRYNRGSQAQEALMAPWQYVQTELFAGIFDRSRFSRDVDRQATVVPAGHRRSNLHSAQKHRQLLDSGSVLPERKIRKDSRDNDSEQEHPHLSERNSPIFDTVSHPAVHMFYPPINDQIKSNLFFSSRK